MDLRFIFLPTTLRWRGIGIGQLVSKNQNNNKKFIAATNAQQKLLCRNRSREMHPSIGHPPLAPLATSEMLAAVLRLAVVR